MTHLRPLVALAVLLPTLAAADEPVRVEQDGRSTLITFVASGATVRLTDDGVYADLITEGGLAYTFDADDGGVDVSVQGRDKKKPVRVMKRIDQTTPLLVMGGGSGGATVFGLGNQPSDSAVFDGDAEPTPEPIVEVDPSSSTPLTLRERSSGTELHIGHFNFVVEIDGIQVTSGRSERGFFVPDAMAIGRGAAVETDLTFYIRNLDTRELTLVGDTTAASLSSLVSDRLVLDGHHRGLHLNDAEIGDLSVFGDATVVLHGDSSVDETSGDGDLRGNVRASRAD